MRWHGFNDSGEAWMEGRDFSFKVIEFGRDVVLHWHFELDPAVQVRVGEAIRDRMEGPGAKIKLSEPGLRELEDIVRGALNKAREDGFEIATTKERGL